MRSIHVPIHMVKIMALSILRDLAHRIKISVFYSIMADETADAPNRHGEHI